MSWDNHSNNITEYQGFVYVITELNTGMYYIGKKNYWKIIKRPPLKGKKRRRHCKVETDWKEYNSSNKILQDKMSVNPLNYTKHIIKNCSSKQDMSVYETYYQLKSLIHGDWDKMYNEMVNIRVRVRKSEKVGE